jgi:hypothetical protein
MGLSEACGMRTYITYSSKNNRSTPFSGFLRSYSVWNHGSLTCACWKPPPGIVRVCTMPPSNISASDLSLAVELGFRLSATPDRMRICYKVGPSWGNEVII